MRIGYGKMGRTIDMDADKWGEAGGDNEPAALLLTLARRHPDVTWVVLGRNSGWAPPLPNIENPWQEWARLLQGVGSIMKWVDGTMQFKYHWFEQTRHYDAITGPMYDTLDGIVMWLGQHGTSNNPIPKIADRAELTRPQMAFTNYCAHIIRGINRWRDADPVNREEVWLLADVRNNLKAHDLKWPRRYPILAQFDFQRKEWEERYGDPRPPEECGFGDMSIIEHEGKWKSIDYYVGSGLEMVGIQPRMLDVPAWSDRVRFGIIINEARNYGMKDEFTRAHAMKHWVQPCGADFVFGTWTAPTLLKLQMNIRPLKYDAIYDKMATARSTFTTPSSGSGWATAKPWESFASGTICFFHPAYDTQNHILRGERWDALRGWLRPRNPAELIARVNAVNDDEATYNWLRDEQYALLDQALTEQRAVTAIEQRLGL
jgi:hypothetical protein